MRILNKSALEKYGRSYGPDAARQLGAWYEEVTEAEWENSQDVKKTCNSTSVIDNQTVVFDICHNRYRLAVKIQYSTREVLIKFFGTHAEYDRKDMKGL